MAALMFRNDFQTGADCKRQPRDEWIPETDTVYIVVARMSHQLSGIFVPSKKCVQNVRSYLSSRCYFPGGSSTDAGIGRNVIANEPTAEPAEMDRVDLPGLATFQ